MKTLLIYTFSNAYVLLFQMTFQFLVLGKFSDIEYGIYSSAQLFSSYIVFFTAGLQTNLAVKISKNNGRDFSVDEINSTLTYFVILIIFGMLFAAFYDYVTYKHVRTEHIVILFFATVKAIIIQKFLNVILRSSDQIRSLSLVQLIVSTVLYITIWSIKDLNLIKISFLLGLECTVSIFLLWIKSDIKFELSIKKIRYVLFDGLQYWKVNLLFLFFPIIVSSLAMSKLGIVEFGKFSIFFVILSMFSKLTQSVDKLNYIDISEKATNIEDVSPLKIFSKNIVYFFLVGLVTLVCFALFGEFILELLLPNRISEYYVFLLAILMSILGLFNYFNVYYDVTQKFKLKYISIIVKIMVFLLTYSVFNFLGLMNSLILCEIVILAEIVSIITNIIVLNKTIFRVTATGLIS